MNEDFEYLDELGDENELDEDVEVDEGDEVEDVDPDESEVESEDEDDSDAVDEDDDEEEDEPVPPKTGNRKKDGIAKAKWAVRKRARKAERELKETQEKLAKFERELALARNQMQFQHQPQHNQSPKLQEPEDVEIELHDLDGSISKKLTVEQKRQEIRRMRAEEIEWQERLSDSLHTAREEFEDLDLVLERFTARQTPQMARMVRKQPDPAVWAYRKQKAWEAKRSTPSKREKELEAELTLLKSKLKKDKKGTKKPRKSLARAPGSRQRVKQTNGPVDDNQFFSAVFSKKE